MAELWHNQAELDAARDRFELAIPGWQRPAAWGIGFVHGDGVIEFVHTNAAFGFLPAVVVGSVVGHVRGSRSYRLTIEELDRAITLLEPAAGATMMEHPNLAALRAVRGEPDRRGAGLVAFIGDLADEPDDDAGVAALRNRLNVGADE